MSDSLASSKPTFNLSKVIQSKVPDRRDPEEYRELIKEHYNGPAGWFTLVTGFYTGHESLADSIFRPEGFDVRGCRRILDAGTGNGRYLRFLDRMADPDAQVIGCDLSIGMLRRAERRIQSDRPELLIADLTRLPYADGAFDAVVCGWVLEHLQEPIVGIRELARILAPGGKLLIMTTEASLFGSVVSRFYHSRMNSRADLRAWSEACGLSWGREYWFSKVHKFFHWGGIVVELRKPDAETAPG